MGLPPFAVVDVETSGLRPGRHHVLQIGVVSVDANGAVVERWETKIRLPHWWSRVGPRRVHGIDRRTLRRAPTARAVVDELLPRLDGAVFVAHNADFDATFLEQLAARSGAPISLRPRLCTLELSRRLDPERALSHRLGDVTARYGVTIERHHDALADATATAAILPKLLADAGIGETDQLDEWYLRDRGPRQRRPWPKRWWRRIRWRLGGAARRRRAATPQR